MRWATPAHRASTNGVCGDGGGSRNWAAERKGHSRGGGGRRRASRPIQRTNAWRAPLGGQVTTSRVGTRPCVAGQWLGTAARRRGGAPLARRRGGGSGAFDEKSQTHTGGTRGAGAPLVRPCRRAVRKRERTGDWGAACLELSRCTTARGGQARYGTRSGAVYTSADPSARAARGAAGAAWRACQVPL